MKSTLLNMVLVLGGITLVAATVLGLVYNVTKGPIEAAKGAKTTDALAQVMPAFDNDPSAQATVYEIDGMPVTVYTGTQGGQVSGYAVETMTKKGFSGEIKLMVGFDPEGKIVNIEVLQHNETPGLGSKMADPGNVLLVSFQGKDPGDLKMNVSKDGGDIDVITASTISSRAYVDAVERGYKAFQSAAFGTEIEQQAPIDPFAELFGAYTNEPLREMRTVAVDTSEVNIYPVTSSGDLLGYAAESSVMGNFGGMMTMFVGFTPDGTIKDVIVTEQHESQGYGAVVAERDNVIAASLRGKNAGDVTWSIVEDGGSMDAITGATGTSRTFARAAGNAYAAYQTYITTFKTRENE